MNHQKKEKIRLDELLVQKELTATRSKARQLIKDREVLVNNKAAKKPGQLTSPDDKIQITRQQYVSRSAHKLIPALAKFEIDPTDMTIGDIGASTGGFTEALLEQNANKIYAIDAGHDQLAEKLRQDPRVINLEKTNIRSLTPDSPKAKEIEPLDLCVVDLSFISLRLALPNIAALIKPTGRIITLFKPQFEVGSQNINHNGIAHRKATEIALEEFAEWCRQNHLKILKQTPSKLRGKTGNLEYLQLIKKT